jgi:hypothetical protein
MVVGTLETVQLVSDVASNAMTVIALLVGALWAVWAFKRERTRWPKANLELAISHRELTPDQRLLNVKVKVHNTGRGLMKLTELRVDLRQVLPLADEAAEDLRRGALIEKGIWRADWPMRDEDEHICRWGPGQEQEVVPRIEPGENDEFRSDFVVPSTWETVYVYVYLTNAAVRGRDELGWTVTSYYDLTGSEGGGSASNAIVREAV